MIMSMVVCRVKPQSSNGFKTFCFLCRLESAEDQVFAAFCEKQSHCKWFVLSDLLNKSSQGVAAWLSPLLEKVQALQPGAQGSGVQRHNGGGVGATEPFTSPKTHQYNKPQVSISFCNPNFAVEWRATNSWFVVPKEINGVGFVRLEAAARHHGPLRDKAGNASKNAKSKTRRQFVNRP